MEKMDSEQACQHDKVRDPHMEGFISGDDRKYRPWICRLCGEEGQEGVAKLLDSYSSEYNEIKQKKSRGGFNVPR